MRIDKNIIGKVKMDKNNVSDVSTYVKPGQQGTIDKVNVSNRDGMTVMIVRIKHVRDSEIGDHFASHYAQIPIICRTLPEGDMPI